MRADETSFEKELGLLKNAPGLMKEKARGVEYGNSIGSEDENPGRGCARVSIQRRHYRAKTRRTFTSWMPVIQIIVRVYGDQGVCVESRLLVAPACVVQARFISTGTKKVHV